MEQKEIKQYLEMNFPKWELLEESEKEMLCGRCFYMTYQKGQVIHRSAEECKGIMLVIKGQLRPYIQSDEGREITLFRVKSGEVCILTASCLMDSLAFDVLVDTIEDAQVLLVPSNVLAAIFNKHMELELYMHQMANKKFVEMIWLIQQILFFSADQRVADFLWKEFRDSENGVITYTHEEIAKLIGSAREVVSKVLKYLAEDGAVILGRGKITLKDEKILKKYL